jgi:hypothetical protein
MAKIDQHFKLKDGSVKSLTSYLGADVGKYNLPDGTEASFLSSNTHVKNVIKNVEDWLSKISPSTPRHHGLKTKVVSLFQVVGSWSSIPLSCLETMMQATTNSR